MIYKICYDFFCPFIFGDKYGDWWEMQGRMFYFHLKFLDMLLSCFSHLCYNSF